MAVKDLQHDSDPSDLRSHHLAPPAATLSPPSFSGNPSRTWAGPGLCPCVLVINADTSLTEPLQALLAQLPAEMQTTTDVEHGLQLACMPGVDLILLDWQMPELDGLALCRELRARGITVPVLMLSHRASELDRVLALEMGADDYVSKPFSLLELQARIKALLRRGQGHPKTATVVADSEPGLHVGSLHIRPIHHVATLAGAPLQLTPREWDLLRFFAEHVGEVFSRAALLDAIWGETHEGFEHTVNSHINRLRGKLQTGHGRSACIQTVWGLGYRFDPPT